MIDPERLRAVAAHTTELITEGIATPEEIADNAEDCASVYTDSDDSDETHRAIAAVIYRTARRAQRIRGYAEAIVTVRTTTDRDTYDNAVGYCDYIQPYLSAEEIAAAYAIADEATRGPEPTPEAIEQALANLLAI